MAEETYAQMMDRLRRAAQDQQHRQRKTAKTPGLGHMTLGTPEDPRGGRDTQSGLGSPQYSVDRFSQPITAEVREDVAQQQGGRKKKRTPQD